MIGRSQRDPEVQKGGDIRGLNMCKALKQYVRA